MADQEDGLLGYHLRKLESLRLDRSNFDNQWEEAARLVIPSHRDKFTTGGQPLKQGQKKTEFQFDATPGLACHRFAAVMESLSTPQNSKWHFLTPADKLLKRNRQVREYFETVTDLLFRYRGSPIAAFVANIQQVFLGTGAYGNGTLYVDAPDLRPGLRYRYIHLAETYFVPNHAGIIDQLYRPFWLKAHQAVELFPNCPEQIRTDAGSANQSDKMYQFLHVCGPRNDYVPGMFGPKGKPFVSLYFCVEPRAMLSEGGYHTFPYPTTRYTQTDGEDYGRGPAQWVLPALKLLNEEKKVIIKQGHRALDPVLLAHDQGVIDGFTMRNGYLNPGGVTAEGRPLVLPLPTGNIAVGDKMMEMERGIINDAFLISLFQILVENPQMTATEVLERMREKGMLLAPLAGRIQSEFLGPLIDRELELLAAQQLLPPMPAILAQAGGEYKIEYDSPMSRMQRAESASGFTRTLQTAAEYAKMTQDQSILDWFNFDEAMPELLDIAGSPIAWTRDAGSVATIRKQRSEAQQTEQMTNAAPGVAQVLKALPQQQGQPA